MGWFENLFSQKGFNRKQFAGAILFVLLPYILLFVSDALAEYQLAIFYRMLMQNMPGVMTFFTLSLLVISIRQRLRNLSLSFWNITILAAPVFNILFLILLFSLKGKKTGVSYAEPEVGASAKPSKYFSLIKTIFKRDTRDSRFKR